MASFFKDLFTSKAPAHAGSDGDAERKEIARLRGLPLTKYLASLNSATNSPTSNTEQQDALLKRYESWTSGRMRHLNVSQRSLGDFTAVNSVDADEETLRRLSKSYYTENYDPLVSIFKTLPKTNEELDFYLMEQVGYYDRILDVINLKLSDAVQGNYSSLISGVRQVQDIDLDITRATIHTRNSRRMLANAKKLLVHGNLEVIKSYRMKGRLSDIQRRMNAISELLKAQHSVVLLRKRGKLSESAFETAKLLELLDHDEAKKYDVLVRMNEELETQLEQIKRDADDLLQRVYDIKDGKVEWMRQVVDVHLLLDEFYAGSGSRLVYRITGGASIAQRLEDTLKAVVNLVVTKTVRDLLLEKFVSSSQTLHKEVRPSLSFTEASQSSIKLLVQHLPKCSKPSTYHLVLRVLESLVEILRKYSGVEKWFAQCVAEQPNPVRRLYHELDRDQDRLEAMKRLQQFLEGHRSATWSLLQGKVVQLLSSPALEFPALKVHQLQLVVTATSTLASLGQAFGGDSVLELRGVLREQVLSYVLSFHQRCLDDLLGFLGRETWSRICISVDELGGPLALLNRGRSRMLRRTTTEKVAETTAQDMHGGSSLTSGHLALVSGSTEASNPVTELLESLGLSSHGGRRQEAVAKAAGKVQVDLADDAVVEFQVTSGGGVGEESSANVQVSSGGGTGEESSANVQVSSGGGTGEESSAEVQSSVESVKDEDNSTAAIATAAESSEGDESAEDSGTDVGGSSYATTQSSDNDTAEEGEFEEETTTGQFDRRVVTASLINCVPACIQRYIQVMRTVPMASGDAIAHLQKLLDTYLIVLFGNMVPFLEASFVMDWQQFPWPKEFQQLAQYVKRASRALGAGQQTGKTAALRGAMLDTSQTYTKVKPGVHSPVQTKTESKSNKLVPSLGIGGTKSDDASWLARVALARAVPTQVPKPLVALENVELSKNTGIPPRIIAAESLVFFMELVQLGKGPVKAACPPVQKQIVEKRMFEELAVVSSQLRLLILKGVGRELLEEAMRVQVPATNAPDSVRHTTSPSGVLRGTTGAISRQLERARRVSGKTVIGGSGPKNISGTHSERSNFISQSVHTIKWGQMRTLQTEHNKYVDGLLSRMRQLWNKLQRGSGEGRTYPLNACGAIWDFCVMELMEELLDAYGSVKVCSTEGRALMSMDFASIARSLDEIAPQGTFASSAKERVDKYIKAYYYDRESDLLEWVKQNRFDFLPEHLLCLAECGVGANLNNRSKSELIKKLGVLL